MSNTKFFNDAIAEAKAIRETALANAKLALEEAFTPQIQSMLEKKLAEEEDKLDEVDEMEEAKKDMEEATNMKKVKDMDEMKDMDETYDMDEADDMEEGSIEEIDLDELLAELEAAEGQMSKTTVEETAEIEEMADEESMVEAEAEDEVGEITVDELKDIIRSVLADVMGGAEEEMDMETDAEEMGGDEIEMDSEEEIGLDEKKEVEEVKADLNEAIAVINTLKSELNEVNLLNAKLLYVNKLFRSKTLTEAHKVKVINAFDRAETVKEVKNIYEILKESLNVATKAPIKEFKAFASKAAGVAQKQTIVEGIDFVSRMQKLAGII
jgi:hypothetical protein